MRIKDFKAEYQNGQMFLSERTPAFSWKLDSEEKNVLQTAYRLMVYKKTFSEEELVWDSGVVESGDNLCQEYAGKELESQAEYKAFVQVWDNKGNQAEDSLDFEMTLFSDGGFRGKWITYPGEEMEACPIFIRRFQAAGNIQKARLYASACGIYKVQVNGEKAGKGLLTPGWTEYHNRICYQAYDVTENLKRVAKSGEPQSHTVEMTVAKGWYAGIYNFFCTPHIYGEKTGAFLELHVWYEDGTKEIIATDEEWTYTTGEIRYAEIYHGQMIDYTHAREKEKPVQLLEKPTVMLTPQECLPVRIMEYRRPVAKIITPKGERVLDFGQNMAGFVQARLCLEHGRKVTIRHGETLDENGNFYTTNLRQAKATDTFVGDGAERTFLPEFTYHGFRYICVEGLEDVYEEDFTACIIYSRMDELCEFSCSNPLLNRLYKNIQWGQKSNFVDIPTDCPQRDERLGWTGDAGVFSKTAAVNMDIALFFKKWLRDVEIAQGDEGSVPAVVPNILGESGAGAAVWGDCVTLIPWNLYQIYGDERILRERYQSMKSWVEYLRRRAGKENLILTGFQYGDWLALDKEGCLEGNMGGTNEQLIASIFYGVSVKIVSDSAKVIGNQEDAREYEELYRDIRMAVNREFMTPGGRIVSDTQTAYVLMLWFDMVDETYKEKMKELFVRNLNRHQNKLSTGFAGTPFLCYALHKIGRTDLAGKILLTEECPGWLYAVKKGATTIWERWDGIKPDGHMEDNGMNSLNHYAYGSIGSWLVEVQGGITPAKPGYRKVKIAPTPIRGLTSVNVRQETPCGTVVSSWKWEDYHMTVDITIPVNVIAEVILPGAPKAEAALTLGSGNYHYAYRTEMNLQEEKYHVDMKLEELFADERACAVMEQLHPGLSTDSGLKTIGNFTIRDLVGMATELEGVFVKVLERLNA